MRRTSWIRFVNPRLSEDLKTTIEKDIAFLLAVIACFGSRLG